MGDQPIVATHIVTILSHPDPELFFFVTVQLFFQIVNGHAVIHKIHQLFGVIGRIVHQLLPPFAALLVTFRFIDIFKRPYREIVADDLYPALEALIQFDGLFSEPLYQLPGKQHVS